MSEATGIVVSELPDDINLDELGTFDELGEGDFVEWIEKPGKYLAELMSVKTQDDGQHTPSENLMFKITNGEQTGKFYMERIYHGLKASKRARHLGRRMKVWNKVQDDEFIANVNARVACNGPDYTPAVGDEFVIELKEDIDKQTGKKSIKMTFIGIWSVDHEDVVGFVAKARGGEGAEAAPIKATATASTATNGKHKAEPAKEPAKTTAKATPVKAMRKPAAAIDEL